MLLVHYVLSLYKIGITESNVHKNVLKENIDICIVFLGAELAVGFRSRVRQCENPVPQYGGLPCLGDAVETVSCVDFKPCFEPGI